MVLNKFETNDMQNIGLFFKSQCKNSHLGVCSVSGLRLQLTQWWQNLDYYTDNIDKIYYNRRCVSQFEHFALKAKYHLTTVVIRREIRSLLS